MINELIGNKVYVVMSSGFTPEREVVGVYEKLEDAKAKFEQEKKAIKDYIADSDKYSVCDDEDDYFSVYQEDTYECYETMIVSKMVE